MKKSFLILFLFALSFVIISCVSKTVVNHPNDRLPSSITVFKINFFNVEQLSDENVTYSQFDLEKDADRFELALNKFLIAVKERKQKEKEDPTFKFPDQYVSALDHTRPYNYFDLTDKSLKLAAEKMLQLLQLVKKDANDKVSKYQIMQLARAVEHKYTNPTKTEFEALAFPIYLVKYLSSPDIERKENVEDYSPEFLKQSLQSDFEIEGKNLHDFLSFEKPVKDCEYLKPKTGYGRRAGFQITCNGNEEYKVKFGVELHSGPFNSRLYRTVGYTVPHINYIDQLQMKYNRKMLVEFNERQRMLFKIYFAGIKIGQFTNKKIFDPFTVIKEFILKDGTRLSSDEVKAKLLKDINKIEIKDEDFNNSDFEQRISDIVYIPATLTVKNDPVMGEDIGHWDPTDLDYETLKEVRGLLVVSAWVGNYDLRKDNLKVTLAGKGKNSQIKLTIGDAGAGLGKSNLGFGGLLTAGVINDMKWTVSSRYMTQGAGPEKNRQQREVFQLDGLTIIESNKAFSKIKLSDAQWMLRKMCKISKQQLTEALVASGMSSAEVVLTREKLIFRRNKMLVDFLMTEDEIKSCHVEADKKISYNPEKDGLISVKSDIFGTVEAPARNKKVVSGKIID